MLTKKLINLLPDLLFVTLLSLLSYFLVSFYSHAQYISTGYYDWFMHAFRVKLLQEYGLTSWIHFWANGINVWQSYQLLPHLTTLLVANIFHVSITRAMVLLTIAIFILVRILIYAILRWAKFSPFVAFSCAVISLTTQMYWISVSDYSLQFGILFILIYVFLWQFYLKGKLNFIFPFLVGLSFYINPVFTFYAGILWVFGLLFSEKKLFSIKVLFEIIVFLIGTSWFLYPLLFKSSYLFSNPIYESLFFLSSYTNANWLGFSLSLMLLFPLVFINLFIKFHNSERWLKILGIYVIFCFLLIITGTNIQLPYVLSAFQFTRGVPMIAVALCLAVAPIISKITRRTIFQFLLVFFITCAFIEGVWISSTYAPSPEQIVYDPVLKYISSHPGLKNARFFSPLIDITSYFAPSTIHLPYSYMGHLDSNPVSPRLLGLINYYSGNDEASIVSTNRIDNYFKIAGTKYVIFSETSPFAKAYLDKSLALKFKNLGKIDLPQNIYYIFEVPWVPHNAVLINKSLAQNLDHFPFSTTFKENNDYIALDNYIQNFTTTIYDPRNTVLSISYPTQESLTVKVPTNRKSNVIYIDESYSKDWIAKFNGISQVIKPVGPNYMAVTLSNTSLGGALTLTHSWPKNMLILAGLIFLTPIIIGIYNLVLLIFFKKKV